MFMKVLSLLVLMAVCIHAAGKPLALTSKPHRNPQAPTKFYKKFEGDIRVPANFDPIALQGSRQKRKAVADRGLLWPQGLIPYTISSKFNVTMRKLLEDAMRQIEHSTELNGKKCIQFTPRASQKDYVLLEMYRDCWSELGRLGKGEQVVSLGRQCYTQGTIMHELIHTLGFLHEQSRADRDKFVDIHFNNIRPGAEPNFKKHLLGVSVDHLNQPYDYDSIMHYQSNSFAQDMSKPTITPKFSLAAGVHLGQRDHLSSLDVRMIQILYGCDTCKDRIPDCADYGAKMCSLYKPWAEVNCPKFCNYPDCKASKQLPTTTPVLGKVAAKPTNMPSCKDVDDCSKYSKAACSMFKSHMIIKCPRYCSLCPDQAITATVTHALSSLKTAPKSSVTTTTRTTHTKTTAIVTTSNKVIPVEQCTNTIENCADYGKGLCQGIYKGWMQVRCQKFCGFCLPSKEVTTSLPTTTLPGCSDAITDCADYKQVVCDSFRAWSMTHCPVFCGFCTNTQGECKDLRNDCSDFGKSQCGGDYTFYMKTNCASFCGYC